MGSRHRFRFFVAFTMFLGFSCGAGLSAETYDECQSLAGRLIELMPTAESDATLYAPKNWAARNNAILVGSKKIENACRSHLPTYVFASALEQQSNAYLALGKYKEGLEAAKRCLAVIDSAMCYEALSKSFMMVGQNASAKNAISAGQKRAQEELEAAKRRADLALNYAEREAAQRDRQLAILRSRNLSTIASLLETRPDADKKPSSGKSGPPNSKGQQSVGSGTGFFVSGSGHVITNAHVVVNCSTLKSVRGDLRTIAIDRDSDLALLQAKDISATFASLRSGQGARPGEAIVALGFPLSGLLSADPIVTTGTISALSGLKNDRRMIQISAPVQPGNSGGPVYGANGALIGVVTSKLNALEVARATGDIPQNVNFAVSLGTLQSFLDAYGVPYELSQAKATLAAEDIATMAAKYTIRIECRN